MCNKKVHILSYGSYGIEEIVYAASTREKAEEVIEKYPSTEWRSIEEFEVDAELPDLVGQNLYFVRIFKDGSIERIENIPHITEVTSIFISSLSNVHFAFWAEKTEGGFVNKPCFEFYVLANSEEHAAELSQEKRQELIVRISGGDSRV